MQFAFCSDVKKGHEIEYTYVVYGIRSLWHTSYTGYIENMLKNDWKNYEFPALKSRARKWKMLEITY